MNSRITRIADAPLPTADPWAGMEPGPRCPACGLPEPGPRRCRRCRAATAVRIDKRRPLSVNMVNLVVILVGRGPLLLAVAFLFRDPTQPLLSPWIIWFGVGLVLFWLAAGGLMLRWRWTWFLALGTALVDLCAVVGLQLLVPGPIPVAVAAIAADLMVLGLLLMVYDEVRITYALIDLPEDHALPKTPAGAYDAGVEASRNGRWYLAARMWQRAVALQHHEGRYRRALALAYLRLNELQAAEAELAAARALLPEDRQVAELEATLRRLQAGRR